MTDLALWALRVSVEELGDVGHDGLLVRSLHVHILRVQELHDPELRGSHQEGGLQPHGVAHVAHRLNVDQACQTNIGQIFRQCQDKKKRKGFVLNDGSDFEQIILIWQTH